MDNNTLTTSINITALLCMGLYNPAEQACKKCQSKSQCVAKQAEIFASENPTLQKQETQTEKRLVSKQTEDTNAKHNIQTNYQQKRQRKKHWIQEQANGDTQLIPEHIRKRLEMPPIGTIIQMKDKGKIYQATIVQDASNRKSEGKSVLLDGQIFRSLTSAARHIDPFINSGRVWTWTQTEIA